MRGHCRLFRRQRRPGAFPHVPQRAVLHDADRVRLRHCRAGAAAQAEYLYSSREEEAFWRSVRLEPSRTAHDLLRKFQELERRLRAAEARVTSSEFKLRREFKDLES
jgi:hypothetical protein